jgi:16S rRNA (guanine966-N2)-methyltransferase
MKRKKPGSLRIIGGRWRGRRLPIPDLPGLRPSGDRSRETLFNWLQHHLRGSRCADLFAGTGALGLEAASRGASEVVLVEKLAVAVRSIRENLKLLESSETAGNVDVVEGDAINWIDSCKPHSLDIVFIDPPFGSGLEIRSLDLLCRGDCLCPGGFAYVETARKMPALMPGPGWEIFREKTLGDVRMQLLKKFENFFERK